jgi:hypothetical protein
LFWFRFYAILDRVPAAESPAFSADLDPGLGASHRRHLDCRDIAGTVFARRTAVYRLKRLERKKRIATGGEAGPLLV